MSPVLPKFLPARPVILSFLRVSACASLLWGRPCECVAKWCASQWEEVPQMAFIVLAEVLRSWQALPFLTPFLSVKAVQKLTQQWSLNGTAPINSYCALSGAFYSSA